MVLLSGMLSRSLFSPHCTNCFSCSHQKSFESTVIPKIGTFMHWLVTNINEIDVDLTGFTWYLTALYHIFVLHAVFIMYQRHRLHKCIKGEDPSPMQSSIIHRFCCTDCLNQVRNAPVWTADDTNLTADDGT